MGDAGPASAAGLDDHTIDGARQREVTVLVLGFGPFKSFTINPSFIIASRLPEVLSSSHPSSPSIKLHIHTSPLLVSYATAASCLPTLLQKYGDPDYIFHIGMAAGRDHYALETRARRDGYIIKDVEERDGKAVGESRWKALGLPVELPVGWEARDVLSRWREVLNSPSHGSPEDEEGGWLAKQESLRGKAGKGELVRLSGDAGKFFCEFILYESLGLRLLEDIENGDRRPGSGRKGKVAFLHVPGATDREGISRGVRVAEAAIRAVVGSWEEGERAEGFA